MVSSEQDSGASQVEPSPDTSPLAPLRQDCLKEPIEYIETFLSQANRAFLLGAGCSVCADFPTMPKLTSETMARVQETDQRSADILAAIVNAFGKGSSPTIEDIMSELVDHLAIAERRHLGGAGETPTGIGKQSCRFEELTSTMQHTKKAVLSVLKSPPKSLNTHREFARAVHGRLHTGRDQTGGTVSYFILNYDTLLEDALAMERVPFADGFEGGPIGWWSPSVYQDVLRNKACVYKVHGSTDWQLLAEEILPRRFRQAVALDSADAVREVMIWPSSTKYRETQLDPYAHILSSMRSILKPQGQAELALAICGYSFGDRHINYELDRALHDSNGKLTILAFTSTDKPAGILEEWLREPAIREQVRIHARTGFFHGDVSIESIEELPWWQFEVLTMLLGGQR